jgi:hypothetical protein
MMILGFDNRPKNTTDFVGFFDEKPNHRSSGRLMSAWFAIGFFGFGTAAICFPAAKDIAIPLAMTSGGYAVVGKQIGKGLESLKGGNPETKELP